MQHGAPMPRDSPEDKIARRVRLGRRLRELRAARGLSVAQVARRLDLDQSFVYTIENGRHAPGFDNLFRLLLLYRVDLLDLLGAVA